MTKKVKLSDVARDLQISTQELIGFYQERDANGNTKKGVTGLTPEEINLALEYYSQKSQVESLDAYFASKDTPKQKQEKKPSEKKPAEKKASSEKKQSEKKQPDNKKQQKPQAAEKKPQAQKSEKPAEKKQLSPSRTMRRSMKSPKSSRQRHRNTASVSM